MPSPTRRERERAARRQAILDAARTVAETDGWPAVTTRRLATLIDYSQPVIYGHFAGKDEIVAAVATDGFAELATELTARRTGASTQAGALRAVCSAYLDFAAANPALYEAMFTRPSTLSFGRPDTLPALQDGFAAFRAVVAPFTTEQDADLRAEVAWAALHGMVSLAVGGRQRPGDQERRLGLLVELLRG